MSQERDDKAKIETLKVFERYDIGHSEFRSGFKKGWDKALESEAVKKLTEALNNFFLDYEIKSVECQKNHLRNVHLDLQLLSHVYDAFKEFEKAKSSK